MSCRVLPKFDFLLAYFHDIFQQHFPATLQRSGSTGAKNTKIVAGRQLTVEDVRGPDRSPVADSQLCRSLEDLSYEKHR